MSQLNIDTIQNRSGGPVTLTKQSAAKSFVVYKSTTAPAIYNSQSLNVSSLTDQGTATTDINLTGAHSVSTYASSDSGGDGNTGYTTWINYTYMTSSVYRVITGNHLFSGVDTNYYSVQTFGDLA